MKIKSNVKAGIGDPPSGYNHNQTPVRGLKVRSTIRVIGVNNQMLPPKPNVVQSEF